MHSVFARLMPEQAEQSMAANSNVFTDPGTIRTGVNLPTFQQDRSVHASAAVGRCQRNPANKHASFFSEVPETFAVPSRL